MPLVDVTRCTELPGWPLHAETVPSHWSLLELKTVQDLECRFTAIGLAVQDALERFQPEMIFHYRQRNRLVTPQLS